MLLMARQQGREKLQTDPLYNSTFFLVTEQMKIKIFMKNVIGRLYEIIWGVSIRKQFIEELGFSRYRY